MRLRSTILIWILGLAVGVAAGALAAMLLIPGAGSDAAGSAVHAASARSSPQF